MLKKCICGVLVFIILCSLVTPLVIANEYDPYTYKMSAVESKNPLTATIENNILKCKIKDFFGDDKYAVRVGEEYKDLEYCIQGKDGYWYCEIDLNKYTKAPHRVMVYSGKTTGTTLYSSFQQHLYVVYEDGWKFRQNVYYLKNKQAFENVKVNPFYIPPVSSNTKQLSDSITEGAITDEDKIENIYGWIVENIAYDSDSVNLIGGSYSVPDDVIENKKAVCYGISLLFQSMCYAQNIPCVLWSGYAHDLDGSDRHAWCEVYVNDDWYVVDCTNDVKYHIENGERKPYENRSSFLRNYFCFDLNIASERVEIESPDIYEDVMLQTLRDSKYSDWAVDSIIDASFKQLYKGDLDGDLMRPITRGEFCSLIVDYLYMQLSDRNVFNISYSDVMAYLTNGKNSLDNPFYTEGDSINWDIVLCYSNGIVYGRSDHYFGADEYITREEAATMLTRMMTFLHNCDSSKYSMSSTTSYRFADDGNVHDWAKDSVGLMADMGIMTGVGGNIFDPQGLYSVEQSIATISRIYNLHFVR